MECICLLLQIPVCNYMKQKVLKMGIELTIYSGVLLNSREPLKYFHISRNFTLTVASCISVTMPGDFRFQVVLY